MPALDDPQGPQHVIGVPDDEEQHDDGDYQRHQLEEPRQRLALYVPLYSPEYVGLFLRAIFRTTGAAQVIALLCWFCRTPENGPRPAQTGPTPLALPTLCRLPSKLQAHASRYPQLASQAMTTHWVLTASIVIDNRYQLQLSNDPRVHQASLNRPAASSRLQENGRAEGQSPFAGSLKKVRKSFSAAC